MKGSILLIGAAALILMQKKPITSQAAGSAAVEYINNPIFNQDASNTLVDYANNMSRTGSNNLDIFNSLVNNYNDTVSGSHLNAAGATVNNETGLITQNADAINLFAPNVTGYVSTPYGLVNDQRAYSRPTADSNGNITFPLMTSDGTVWLNGNSSQQLSNLDGYLGAQQMIQRGLYTVHTL